VKLFDVYRAGQLVARDVEARDDLDAADRVGRLNGGRDARRVLRGNKPRIQMRDESGRSMIYEVRMTGLQGWTSWTSTPRARLSRWPNCRNLSDYKQLGGCDQCPVPLIQHRHRGAPTVYASSAPTANSSLSAVRLPTPT
jgi:hypothetical protein